MTTPTVKQDAADTVERHTGGMVALIPAVEDAERLAVDGGDPPDQLHLTLAYLGEDVTEWDPELVEAVHTVVRELTDPGSRTDDVEPVPDAPGTQLVTLTVFAHSRFNPNGGPDDQEPCMVYQFSGEGDLNQVEALHSAVCYQVKEAIGEVNFPEQHARFQPHVTAGYNLPPDALSYTGLVTFDRLRVALGDKVTDYPLGGDGMEDGSVTAALRRTPGGAVTAESREAAKRRGHTMGDGSFPIESAEDLANAIQSVGRAKDPEAARRHIIAQAKRLGLESKIPDSWRADGSVTASAVMDTSQREALTAAATALMDRLGPADAYLQAPMVFTTPETLTVADLVISPPLADGEPLTASAGTALPSIDLFTPPPDMPPGMGHYVDNEPLPGGFRRVYGRLAEWDVPHIGFDGREVYAPRSPSGYRWFHTKSAWVQGPDGPERLPIGHLTFGTGHASTSSDVSPLAAAAHYDNSGFRGAKVRMSEDEYGPVYAGVTVSGLEGARLEEFTESDTSGDWRRIMGKLDLVAALCVNVGGFPKVGLSLAASGEIEALVASTKAWGRPPEVDYDALADAVAERVVQRQALTAALTFQRDTLLAETDDTEDRVVSLLVELFGDEIEAAIAEYDSGVTADAMPVSRMPLQLQKSYVAGKVAQRIRWGVPGDFKRCVAQAKIHGMGRMAEGACAMLHHKALGAWPGREHAVVASLEQQVDLLLAELDDDSLTAGVRYVRTPEGAARYRVPIGSPIPGRDGRGNADAGRADKPGRKTSRHESAKKADKKRKVSIESVLPRGVDDVSDAPWYRNAFQRYPWNEAKSEKVSISKLNRTQSTDETIGTDYKPNANPEPIRVIRYQGKDWVYDGHHRIVGAHLAGQTNIRANVIDLDKR